MFVAKLFKRVNKLGFNVPSATRLYIDGSSLYSLMQKNGRSGEEGVDLVIPGLVVHRVIHYTSAAP